LDLDDVFESVMKDDQQMIEEEKAFQAFHKLCSKPPGSSPPRKYKACAQLHPERQRKRSRLHHKSSMEEDVFREEDYVDIMTILNETRSRSQRSPKR